LFEATVSQFRHGFCTKVARGLNKRPTGEIHMSKNIFRSCSPAFLLIFLAAFSGCDYESIATNWDSDVFHQTLSLAKGGSFQLDNINGNITVQTWDQPNVIIDAEKKAPTRDELDAIKIEVKQEGDHVEVHTRYPHWPSFHNSRGMVGYHITVPRDVRVQLESVNGQIRTDGMLQDLQAKAVNGGIEITEAHGGVSATTVNGSIHTTLRESSGGNCHFSTTNGSITIRVAENINARFEGHTVNGGIHTNLPLSVTGRIGKNLSGQIGTGGIFIQLQTVNGGISLNRF
jgi:hypothetical protein